MEISQDVSKAAVQCNRSLDVDECYLWALEHANDEEMVALHKESFDKEVGKILFKRVLIQEISFQGFQLTNN